MMTRKFSSPAAAVVAASLLAVASSTAMAAVVCNAGTVPIAVPQDGTGIYLNLITGAASPAAPSGWDFNPYDRKSPGMSFWFNNDPNRGGMSNDGVAYAVLASGESIGPGSTFITDNEAVAMANFTVGQTGGYVGLRVFNEGTSTMNYGWVQMDTGATGGYPATINSYCYQDDGSAITAGTTPVTLQTYSID